MDLPLSPETQRLIEERMERHGFATADDVVRAALDALDGQWSGDLDEETLAALREGERQLDAGEGRPWEQVREELRAKFLDPS